MVSHIAICAIEIGISMAHISICATESLSYVAYIFYAPKNSDNSVEHFFMRRRNNFFEARLLKCTGESISIYKRFPISVMHYR
jgi:hypothetical protein